MNYPKEESLFHGESYAKLLDRLNNIEKDTKPIWGEMSAAQMMAHCAEIQEVTNGKALKTPFFLKLMKPMIKKFVLKGEFKQGEQTHPAYKQTEEKDFATEKTRFLAAMNKFVEAGEQHANELKHPYFGQMTAEEKGRMLYKHLEHHLNQFDV